MLGEQGSSHRRLLGSHVQHGSIVGIHDGCLQQLPDLQLRAWLRITGIKRQKPLSTLLATEP